jgi:hypothetical protein
MPWSNRSRSANRRASRRCPPGASSTHAGRSRHRAKGRRALFLGQQFYNHHAGHACGRIPR